METIGESVWHITYWEISIRLVAALLLGGLIGLEREWNNHAAGFRTHILVCLGAASIMLLSIHGFPSFVDEFNVRVDPARLGAQVINGIGFLGAGAIMRTGSAVSGLTTAASIWVVAAIGLCVGSGFFYAAGMGTLLVLISLFVLNKLDKVLSKKRKKPIVTLQMVDKPGLLKIINSNLERAGVEVANMNIVADDGLMNDSQVGTVKLQLTLNVNKTDPFVEALEKIARMDDVKWIESDHWMLSKKLSKSVETSA